MYRIGEFSKITKATVKTLRYYDEVGLLKPARVGQDNGYRYYTTQQMVDLQHIIALRQVGLSIEEVLQVLSGKNIALVLDQRKGEIQQELLGANRQLSMIESILDRGEEEFFMNYQAIIKDLPECTVFYKQGMVPNFSHLGEFICGAGEECRAANPTLKCSQPDYCFITYLDPEFKDTDAAVEYAQAVTHAGKETETIKFKKIESVTAVCLYHKGRYEKLGEAYAFAYKWLEDNGYTPAARPREFYIDGIWNKENPEDWLTEIQIPIEKK